MSFQPPPPPPGSQPPAGSPPPPPGGYGPPPGGGPGGPGRPGGFDPKSFNPLDWGIVGAGVLAFIFSLFDYYTASVSIAGYGSSSGSESAWHGFFGWFAALLAVIGAALVAVSLFAPHVKLPVPARLAGLGAFALATISVIIALFVFPESVPDGVDTGRGFGYWVSLIAIIAGLVLSLMRFQATGGQLPGGLQGKVPNVGGYGPQGGISGASNAPQPGYGRPQPPQPGYGQQQPPPPPGYGQQPPPPPGYGPPQ